MCVAAAESSEPSALPWLCPLLEFGPEVAGSPPQSVLCGLSKCPPRLGTIHSLGTQVPPVSGISQPQCYPQGEKAPEQSLH